MNRAPIPRAGAFALLLLFPVAPALAAQESPGAARLAKGNQLLAEDEIEKAAKEFEAVALSEPSLAAAHEASLRAWLAAGNPKKAVEAGRTGVEKCPDSGPLRAAYGRALVAAGSHVEALAASEKALELRGAPAAEALRVKAEATAALDPEGVPAGLKVLAAAIAKTPADARLLEETGDFLLAHDVPDQALPHLRKAVEADRGRVESRLLLVRALLRTKDMAGAREAAQAAADGFPASAEARAILGRTYEEAGEPAAAVPHYEAASKMRPKRAGFLVDLGFVLARSGRWKEAAKTLLAALKIDPANAEGRFHYGWVLNRDGDLAGALDQYAAVLKSQPEHPRALWNCADISAILGKSKEAQQYCEKLLAVDPKHSEAHRLLAFVNFRNGKVEEAHELVGKSLELDPKNARAHFLQGQLWEVDGDWEAAEKSYQASMEADPKLSWPHLYLGELYDEVLGRPVDALKALRKYLELGGPDPDGAIQKTVDALAKETGR